MTYTITPSDDGKYIILKVMGDISRHTAMQHIVEAHVLGGELGTNRFLVDLSESRNIDSTIDQYEFVHTDMMKPEEIDRSARVAALVSPDDHTHDFVETVIRNAGFILRLFRDRDAALGFLRE